MDDPHFSDFISMLLQILPVFYGMEEENPFSHLQKFEKIFYSLFKESDIDRLFYKYFPYSLRDNAFYWFVDLPLDSSTTWSSFQTIFMLKYFPNFNHWKMRQNAINEQLMKFTQLEQEAYCHSWERFNNLIHMCSHLQFSGEDCLQIFYGGLRPQVQSFVHMMNDGAFSKCQPEEAWNSLGELADFEKNEPFEFEKRWNNYFSSNLEDTLLFDQCQTFIEDPKTLANSIEEGASIEPSYVDDHIQYAILEDQEEEDGVCVSKDGDVIHFYFYNSEQEMSEGEEEIVDFVEPEPFSSLDSPSQLAAHESIEEIAVHKDVEKEEVHEGEGIMIDITTPEPCPLPCSSPQQLPTHQEALHPTEYEDIFQGSFYELKYLPFESQSLTTYSLDSNDDPIWQTFIDGQDCPMLIDTTYSLQDIDYHLPEVCWVVSKLCHNAEDRGATLAEKRKDLIEQLPPPFKILDPPFDLRCIISSSVAFFISCKFHAF